MEVFFKTERLALVLGSPRDRSREFGLDGATRIDLRLQQMMSAPTLADMKTMPGRCRELDSDQAGHFAIDISRLCQLTFYPSDIGHGGEPEVGRDWRSIDSITVSDYQRLSARRQP